MRGKGARLAAVLLVSGLCTLILAFSLVACGSGPLSGGSAANGGADPSFEIEGKWKVVGNGSSGQMQKGAVIVFDGENCNVFSPGDTYAFYQDDDGSYRLDVTGLLGGSPSFEVTLENDDHISLKHGKSTTVELKRVG